MTNANTSNDTPLVSSLQKISSARSFGGEQLRFEHASGALSCTMRFSVYLPPDTMIRQRKEKVPVLYWLSGLTCTDENFVHKAGAQRVAAKLGIAIVMPDTSPRGDDVADAPDKAWDLGLGAGFYVNATREPWRKHYRMYDYIVHELPALVESALPVSRSARSIAGHSMGGHGALMIGLRNPDRYCAISAFAPIVAPMRCPWGQKAFTHYLGVDVSTWREYDACELILEHRKKLPLLVDQGGADQFLVEQLRPQLLEQACAEVGYPLQYHSRPGYDHSYYYIASFIEEHLRFHAAHLNECK